MGGAAARTALAWQIACSVGGRGVHRSDAASTRSISARSTSCSSWTRVKPGGRGRSSAAFWRTCAHGRAIDSAALATGARAAQWVLLSSIAKRIMGVLAAAQPLQGLHLDPLGRYPDPDARRGRVRRPRHRPHPPPTTAAMDALVRRGARLAERVAGRSHSPRGRRRDCGGGGACRARREVSRQPCGRDDGSCERASGADRRRRRPMRASRRRARSAQRSRAWPTTASTAAYPLATLASPATMPSGLRSRRGSCWRG